MVWEVECAGPSDWLSSWLGGGRGVGVLGWRRGVPDRNHPSAENWPLAVWALGRVWICVGVVMLGVCILPVVKNGNAVYAEKCVSPGHLW